MPRLVRNDRIRMWLMEGGAGPFVIPSYESVAKVGTPRLTRGTGTPVTNQSADILGEFDIIDETPPARTLPTLPLTSRFHYERSKFLRMYEVGCYADVQAHVGTCQDPKDFNGGWDKIVGMERAKATDYSTSGDLGALNESDRAFIDEVLTLTGLRYYEINKINLAELATATITTEVMDLVIADRVQCSGLCGTASDGCQKLFAIQTDGTLAWSDDGGATWNTSATGATTPIAIVASGQNLIVVSKADLGIWIANINDIIEGTEVWAEVNTGFVATKGPNRGVSIGASLNWFVGDGGYIYFAEDPASEVTVLDAGNATVQNLLSIAAYDDMHLVAVGAGNVVLYTANGGETWSLVVGPSVGQSLLSVAMKSESEWIVSDDIGGLFATRNNGRTWKTIAKPAGIVNDIKFSSNMVGWAAQTNAGAGRVLRTVDGGRSWYVAPEGPGAVPTNQELNRIAVCKNVDHAYFAGLGALTDGIIVEAA